MIIPDKSTGTRLFFITDKKDEEINVQKIIIDFFDDYHLEEIRTLLWEWLKMALENRNITGENGQISRFIFLYEKLNDLITANYLQKESFEPK